MALKKTFVNLIISTVCLVHSQDITVPAPNIEIVKVRGVGTQNYACVNGAFQFVDPNANLLDEKSKTVGTHFFNPTVDANGGRIVFEVKKSQVTCKPIATVPSPNPNSIVQVLLQVTGTTPGILGSATFGQRTNTVDGIAPAGPCNGTDVVKVNYTADYAFFGPPKKADDDKEKSDDKNGFRPPRRMRY